MDEESTINLSNSKESTEINLPEVVASLKMLAVDKPEEDMSSTVTQRRSSRIRKPRNLDVANLSRRCSLKPRKRTFHEIEDEDSIREYYLDKTVKKRTNCLETIFEEKEGTNQTSAFMSAKRFKRMIQFTSEPTDSKLKKRRERIKKVFGSKVNVYRKRRNVSMQAFLDKLNSLQNEVTINSINDVK